MAIGATPKDLSRMIAKHNRRYAQSVEGIADLDSALGQVTRLKRNLEDTRLELESARKVMRLAGSYINSFGALKSLMGERLLRAIDRHFERVGPF